jgi:hypothetical protein
MPNEAAIALLTENIHALPHPKYGVMNFLPFAHDSEQVRMVKREMAEAVVGLLDSNGFIRGQAPETVAPQRLAVSVKCRVCNGLLFTSDVDEGGVGRVDARMFISMIANLNPECEHKSLTFEDHRRFMVSKAEEQLAEEQANLGGDAA